MMFGQANPRRTLLDLVYVASYVIQTTHSSTCSSMRTSNRALSHVQNILETFAPNTELRCARSCRDNPSCAGLAVRPDVCLLLSRIAPGSPRVGGSDWINYEPDHGDCLTSDSHMYVRELNTCYWHHPEGIYSVYESVHICAEGGGHLVRIDSDMKQLIVEDLMGDHVRRAYIQGNDTSNEGIWKFDDGAPMTYFNWKSDMPRNNTDFNYVIIRSVHDFKWQDQEDLPSQEGISVICEKSLD